jgi:NAD(P)-dependent dehydrogenase (short-subunit alcohol dehydrogenase family)
MVSVIITGANGGLGITVVKRLLKDGYHIYAAAGYPGAGNIPEDERLEVSPVDLVSEEQARKFVDSALVKYPDLRAAILLVGGYAGGNYKGAGIAEIDKMINLNFYTAYNIARPLLSHFLNRPEGGQFILIGSRPGMQGADGKDALAYALSKSMIFKLADIINAEGRDKMVTATVIVPSTIDTDANRKAMPGADFSKWVPAENIADSISFSLSETGRMLRESIIKIYHKS